ncbi:hypothetical protein CCACVL1_16117, partial [Corchorus capsularis]
MDRVYAADRVTTVRLNGTKEKIVSLRTPAITQAWISAEFKLNRRLRYSTDHVIQLILDTTNMVFPNIERLDYEQYYLQQRYAGLRPANILIINAKETRLTGEVESETRQAMGYDSSLSIESLAFFGGIWFLWNSSKVLVQTIASSQRSLT